MQTWVSQIIVDLAKEFKFPFMVHAKKDKFYREYKACLLKDSYTMWYTKSRKQAYRLLIAICLFSDNIRISNYRIGNSVIFKEE